MSGKKAQQNKLKLGFLSDLCTSTCVLVANKAPETQPRFLGPCQTVVPLARGSHSVSFLLLFPPVTFEGMFVTKAQLCFSCELPLALEASLPCFVWVLSQTGL